MHKLSSAQVNADVICLILREKKKEVSGLYPASLNPDAEPQLLPGRSGQPYVEKIFVNLHHQARAVNAFTIVPAHSVRRSAPLIRFGPKQFFCLGFCRMAGGFFEHLRF